MFLSLQQISKSYSSGGKHDKRVILDRLNLEIQEGKRIALIGPSGSGKTTLLNLIGTLDRPDSGKIFMDATDLSTLNDAQLAIFRNQKIGFVFQMHHLLPQLTLLENILLPTLANGGSVQQDTLERADWLIERMGLSKVANQKPSELSGGECQRTAVARALINKPRLMLADEPTGALDKNTAMNLIDLLVELSIEEGFALIMVTHSIDAAFKMEQIYSFKSGKLI